MILQRFSCYRVQMRRMMSLLFAFFLGGYLFNEWLGTEVTLYKMFCTKGRVDGVCKSEEQTANPTTYKVFVEQQVVIYWVGDSSPVRLPFCAVRDARNWSCKYETGSEIPRREYIMSNGNYYEVGEPRLLGSDPFYTVSAWRWWSVWLAQKLK